MRPTTYILSSVLDSTIDRWSSRECKLTASIDFAINCLLTAPPRGNNKKSNSSFVLVPISTEQCKMDFSSGELEDSILNAAREFWSTQEILAIATEEQTPRVETAEGIAESDLICALGSLKCQAPESSGNNHEQVSRVASKKRGKAQNMARANGLDDYALLAFRGFWSLQGISIKEGIKDSACIAFKEFWKTHILSPSGFDDITLVACKDFWRAQQDLAQSSGLDDCALIAAQEFWEAPTATSQDVLSVLGECLMMCNVSIGGLTQEDHFGSIQRFCKGMEEAFAKKDRDLETAAKLRDQMHFAEVHRLHMELGDAEREREELIRTQRDLITKLNKTSIQLEVVDEMIGHNVELEWANNELSRKLENLSQKLRANCNLKRENVELNSINMELNCANRALEENLEKTIREKGELASSNAELRRILLSMEKAGERHFDESYHLRAVIDKLQREKDTPSPQGSTRSSPKCMWSRNSGSKRRISSLSETNLAAPHSAGMLCVNA